MKPAEKSKPKSKRGPQARGNARRELLVSAATSLLEERELDEISLAEVAGLAGIPVASAYTLYPRINAIFSQVMINFDRQMADEFETNYDLASSRMWLDIIEAGIDSTVAFYQKHKAYMRLRLSGKAPAEIRYHEDRVSGPDLAPCIKEEINQVYRFPELENADRLFVIMLDLIDGIFCSAYMRDGHLSESIIEEAKRAAFAYLKLYIPEYLPRR